MYIKTNFYSFFVKSTQIKVLKSTDTFILYCHRPKDKEECCEIMQKSWKLMSDIVRSWIFEVRVVY